MHCHSYVFGISSVECFGECHLAVEQVQSFCFGLGGKLDECSFCAMPAVSIQKSGIRVLGHHDADWNVGRAIEKAQLCRDHVRGRNGHGHPSSLMPSCSGYRGRGESAEVDLRMRLLDGLWPAVGCTEIDVACG